MIYSIDFETRSIIDLKDRGLDVYANDPSTEVICIAFGTIPEDVQVVDPLKPNQHLAVLLDHVRDGGNIQAWNAMFEYAIWNCVCVPKYGWPPLKLEQCIDTMGIAAANNIPQSLEEAGAAMNSDYQKDPIGKQLIQKLCKPHKGAFNYDSELIGQLFEYCKTDVKTEMAIGRTLRPLDPIEQQIWTLTNRINTIGVPVSIVEVENAVTAVKNAQKALDDELLQFTGCKPSERQKLLNWLNDHGAKLENLTAETVTEKLKEPNLNEKVKRALQLRQEGSQTSVAKYAKILEIQRNGRIRNTLVYHGASTGRWASRGGLNLQNIARPTLSDDEIEVAIPRVFGNGVGTMRELSSLVRSAIKAPEGQTFVDVDFSSIENRVGVYLANQNNKVEMFRRGLDEYKVFASGSLFRVPYDEVTKDQRQIAKSAVLGCMFGQGSKGLVDYAKGMGVNLTQAQSQMAVDNYRADYPKVKGLWSLCDAAAIDAVQNPGTAFGAGNRIILKADGRALWMRLPSGRLICWQSPILKEVTTPWGQEKLAVTVMSVNTYTRKWSRNPLIGSSIFQSATQGTARDFLAFSMMSLDKAGYTIVNSIHDEVLLLVDEERRDVALDDVINIMTTPPSWAPDFPLAAEGWVGDRYRK
ncbi:bifunctional 3'-5' exonuclease/DNA polymerase [uncultured Caudovirales phage]|uniref:Bifunctional 3'-5' exonuclease/DNA polymerase n=1 Tax=uncultured Caudovirales phage TaxID=2100421 RepID=A0A6J5L7D0_9CAUD|nr:bifunctional 3'-5' exonuclease/DNA polymerase [uncultured Caudovirales phage]